MWLFPPGLSLMALRVVFILQSGWQWLQYSVQWEGQVYISHYTCHHDPPLSQTFPSSILSHSVLCYSQLSSNKSRIPQTSNNLILFFAQRTWRYYSIKLLISGCRLYRDCFITSLYGIFRRWRESDGIPAICQEVSLSSNWTKLNFTFLPILQDERWKPSCGQKRGSEW